jgi:hypothetical protein
MQLPAWPQQRCPELLAGVAAAVGAAPEEVLWTPPGRDALAVFASAGEVTPARAPRLDGDSLHEGRTAAQEPRRVRSVRGEGRGVSD